VVAVTTAAEDTRPAVKSRKPTGVVPWPFILLEGDEKSGKTWQLALLSASPRVGQTYWLDLGEGAGDEYIAIPGAKYDLLEHDGSYQAILARVLEARAAAQWDLDHGLPPMVLGVDPGSALWDALKDWGTARAVLTASNRRKLEADPGAEIKVPQHVWNDVSRRWRRIMTLLLTFPGIVVMTARGRLVASVGPDGQPVEGKKEWRVEGQRDLAFDATVWVRFRRNGRPQIHGARSVYAGIQPGVDEPREVDPRDDFLEWLIFDVLRCDPKTAHPRDLREVTGGALTAEERQDDRSAAGPDQQATDETWLADRQADVEHAETRAELRQVWDLVKTGHAEGHCTDFDRARLSRQITQRLETMPAGPPGPEPGQEPAAEPTRSAEAGFDLASWFAAVRQAGDGDTVRRLSVQLQSARIAGDIAEADMAEPLAALGARMADVMRAGRGDDTQDGGDRS
jgi:hypothetical protein